MCTTTYCLTVWLPYSTVTLIALTSIGGLMTWKLVKAIVDTIPFAG